MTSGALRVQPKQKSDRTATPLQCSLFHKFILSCFHLLLSSFGPSASLWFSRVCIYYYHFLSFCFSGWRLVYLEFMEHM